MARYVTLKDSNGEALYPQIKSDSIADGSVTSDKIDWATIDYSTPQPIGKWVNGKTLYRKVINIAPLPNAAAKTVATGIDASHIIKITGMAYQPANNRTFLLPFLSDNPSTFITVVAVGTNVLIDSYTADRSSFTTAYLIVDYYDD